MNNVENQDLINITKNNIKLYLTSINSDYSNIDQVYDNNFSKVKNNINWSEVDFIDSELNSLDTFFEKSNNNEKEYLHFYSIYLSKKRSKVKWTLNDYYNHYINTKRFGFNIFISYKSEEYNIFTEIIETYKIRYHYIFEKLHTREKIEFKNDFCDQIEYLKNRQIHSKFKEPLEDLKNYLNNSYKHFKENQKLNPTLISKKSKFDVNFWNENAFDLFEYLVENYTKKGKVKYINIYYFFKNIADKKTYSFMFIQEGYTKYILEKYKIEIKKYEKAQYSFDEKEVPKLKNLEQNFRENAC